MNQVGLRASLVEIQPLRYTPAGVPVIEMQLEHAGEVIEAGKARRINMTLTALAMGELAYQLAAQPLGSELEVFGFLAPTRKGSSRLRLHLQQVKPQPRNEF